MIHYLTEEDVALITESLKERSSKLNEELPDPSVATPEDFKKAALVMRLDALIGKLNPTHCGLHDRPEPCERCGIYLHRIDNPKNKVLYEATNVSHL